MSDSDQFPCRELRIACTIAHMEREGGVSPRISPLAQVIFFVSILLYFFSDCIFPFIDIHDSHKYYVFIQYNTFRDTRITSTFRAFSLVAKIQ